MLDDRQSSKLPIILLSFNKKIFTCFFVSVKKNLYTFLPAILIIISDFFKEFYVKIYFSVKQF